MIHTVGNRRSRFVPQKSRRLCEGVVIRIYWRRPYPHITQGRRSSARIFWNVKTEKDRLLARYCRLLHIPLHNPPQLLRFPTSRKSDKRIVRTALRHGI